MGDNQAQIVVDGNVAPWRRAMQEFAQTTRQAAGEVESRFGTLGRVFDAFSGRFAALAGLASGGAFGIMIKNAADTADALGKLSQKTGIAVEDLSRLQYAAQLSGASNEQLNVALRTLSKNMAEAAIGTGEARGAFDALGLAQDLQAGKFKNSGDLLAVVADRFSQYADGANKSALAQKIFGEAGADLIPMLNAGSAGLRAMGEESDRLGSTLSTELANSSAEFNDNLTRLQGAVQGLTVQIAGPLIRALADLSSEFLRATNEGESFFRALERGFGGGVIGNRANIVGAAADIERLTAEQAKLQRLIDQYEKSGADLPDDLSFRAGKISAELAEARKNYDALAAKLTAPPKAGPAENAPTITPTGGSDKGGKKGKAELDPSFMQYYDAVLAQERLLASERDALRELSKAEEIAYWQTLLQHADLSTKDRLAIEKRVADLSLAERRAAATQQLAVDAEMARSRDALALGQIELERAAVQSAVELDQITKAQQLEIEESFEQRRYEIQRAALEERLRLMALDPNASPAELARIKNLLLELEQQHQLKLQEIKGLRSKEEQDGDLFGSMGKAFTSGEWIGDMTQSFTSGLGRMLTSTQEWSQTMGNLFRSVGSMFLQNVVLAPLQSYMASLARRLAMKLGFLAQETAAEGAAAGATVGIKATEATAVVSANAAEAASGAAASVASIPWVGWAMAAGVFAATMAMVMGAKSSIKSAEGGYDIPAGINPVTQLHEEEMVLPKPYANLIRDMAANGAGEGAASEPPVSIGLNITAFDGRDVRRVLMDNKAALADALKSAVRDFRR